DASDDGFLGRPADEAFELGPHGHASTRLELNAVLADAVEGGTALGRVGAVDDFRVDGNHDRIEDVAAGEVDGGSDAPGQVEAGRGGGDGPGAGLLQVA